MCFTVKFPVKRQVRVERGLSGSYVSSANVLDDPSGQAEGAIDARMDIRESPRPYAQVSLTLACTNQKGGVGKTTTVVNLGTSLARSGDRVLVIDLDPQGNATSGFGIERDPTRGSIYDALVDGRSLEGLDIETLVDGLRLIPSSIELAGAEVELAGAEARERRLARALPTVGDAWDWIFIDCPPSLGLLTVNALTACTAVLVPIQCEYYALEGLTRLTATVSLVRDHLNPQLAIAGVLLTMFDARTNLSAEVVEEVRNHLPDSVFDTVVPRSVRLSEAPSHGLPIALYSPDSKGAEAYEALAREVRARRGRLERAASARDAIHDHETQASTLLVGTST
jgi:chromosome partitioning protein